MNINRARPIQPAQARSLVQRAKLNDQTIVKDGWMPSKGVSTPSLIPSDLSKTPLNRLEGKWVLHTYIGKKLFEDQLALERQPEGELEGHLSVPGGFTAPVENLKARDNLRFSFEIEPDEGNGTFRVFYQAEFDPKDEVFVGFARLENGDLIGGFVAQRPKSST